MTVFLPSASSCLTSPIDTQRQENTAMFASSVHDLTFVLACFHSKHLFVTYTYIEICHSSYVELSEHHPISTCSTVELVLSPRACEAKALALLLTYIRTFLTSTHTLSGLTLNLRNLRLICTACQRERCSVTWVGIYLQTCSYSS